MGDEGPLILLADVCVVMARPRFLVGDRYFPTRVQRVGPNDSAHGCVPVLTAEVVTFDLSKLAPESAFNYLVSSSVGGSARQSVGRNP